MHNTNITHVNAPGGNYDKFVFSGQDEDYLPFWLKNAGYQTECGLRALSAAPVVVTNADIATQISVNS